MKKLTYLFVAFFAAASLSLTSCGEEEFAADACACKDVKDGDDNSKACEEWAKGKDEAALTCKEEK